MKQITSQILKTDTVNWKKLKPIQGEKFKDLSGESYKKLKTSLIKNNFIAPFAVWQDKDKTIYTIPEQGHKGGIYQGGNWVYIGTGGSNEAFYNEKGVRVHSRLVGKGGKKNIFGKINTSYNSDTMKRIKLLPKHKYIYVLDDKLRQQIIPLSKPYPKSLCVESSKSEQRTTQSEGGGELPTSTLHISKVSNG